MKIADLTTEQLIELNQQLGREADAIRDQRKEIAQEIRVRLTRQAAEAKAARSGRVAAQVELPEVDVSANGGSL